MKTVSVEKVIKPACSSFCAVYYENEYFSAPLHIHPEYELILIEKGNGLSFVGDLVHNMQPGDLMLIGHNLPHLWLSSDEYYEKGTSLRSASVYSQFNTDIFPSDETVEEFKSIRQLLNDSQKGLLFVGETLSKLQNHFRLLPKQEGFRKLVMLYEILQELTQCPYKILTSPFYINPFSDEMTDPTIQKANTYIHQHYQENISLQQIADHVGMNPSALCRYYKRLTRKTLFEYLTDIRIAYATKLLAYRNMAISQIAYDCGFNNISYFNRQFKALTGKTPGEYSRSLHNRG